jgi:N6-adenosine-specific RNA methylase IME4
LAIAELPVIVVSVEDELEFMLRQALHRRQLTQSQRAAVAAQLATIAVLRERAKQRQHANLKQNPAPGADAAEVATLPARDGRTREIVAEIAGVSPRTLQDVLTVQEHDDQLLQRVLKGEVSASTAASKVRRALRDAQILPAPAMPDGPFALILADPPWTFGAPDSEFAPEQHYPTMKLGEIKQLQLPAAENCALFLWAVNALLPEAFELIRHWGFTYRSNLVWVKNFIGPGHWLRQRHELLLIATKGDIRAPDPEERVDSVIEAPRTRHSEKPLEAYERIERMYPQFTKLELFARGEPRPGWQIWGNQAEPEPESSNG